MLLVLVNEYWEVGINCNFLLDTLEDHSGHEDASRIDLVFGKERQYPLGISS